VESLAEGGGICISGSVSAQVRNKLKLVYEFLGKKEVKNIEEPVPVYRVLSVPGAAAHRVIGAKRKLAIKWRKVALALVVSLLVIGGGFLAWNFWRAAGVLQQVGKEEAAGLPLSDRPSIAVLAFDNLSGDPKQGYFADGFAEDLITALSQISSLQVAARNSSFTYKGKAVNVKQVGKELGVKYVIEGSVRKSGDQLRVAVQLVDAATGHHVWAKKYDRRVQDMFALQDELTRKVASVLEVHLTEGEAAGIKRSTTESTEAWELYKKGAALLHKTPFQVNLQARKLMEQALQLDPAFAAAILGVGWAYIHEGIPKNRDWGADYDPLERARELAMRAREINRGLSEPLVLLGVADLVKGYYDRAIEFSEQAARLEPDNWETRAWLGVILSYSGRPKDSIAQLRAAMRINPNLEIIHFLALGQSYYMVREYDLAIEFLQKAHQKKKNQELTLYMLLAAYGAAGRKEEGRVFMRYVKDEIGYILSPLEVVGNFEGEVFPFKNPSIGTRIIADVKRFFPAQ
jgi:adenylate cyclase